MLTSLGERVAARVLTAEPWGTGYAIARTLLASATISTLLASPTASLFLPTADRPDYPACTDLARLGIFCLLSDHLNIARWLAVAAMLPVLLGLWPRIFGFVHWWITFSFQANATMVDGGDQVGAILTLLLLPCTLTDPRWHHWSPAPASPAPGLHARLLATSGLLAIRLQVAIIYFHAFVGKCRVPEWLDGTALYYWLLDPHFGAAGARRAFLLPLLQSPAVALLTWSVLIIEGALFMALFMPARTRYLLMWPGLLLHLGIAVLHGLISFSLVMSAALVLYSGWNPGEPAFRTLSQRLLATRHFRRSRQELREGNVSALNGRATTPSIISFR